MKADSLRIDARPAPKKGQSSIRVICIDAQGGIGRKLTRILTRRGAVSALVVCEYSEPHARVDPNPDVVVEPLTRFGAVNDHDAGMWGRAQWLGDGPRELRAIGRDMNIGLFVLDAARRSFLGGMRDRERARVENEVGKFRERSKKLKPDGEAIRRWRRIDGPVCGVAHIEEPTHAGNDENVSVRRAVAAEVRR